MCDECLNVWYIFKSMMHAKCMHVNKFFYVSKLEKDSQTYKLIKQLFLFCFYFLFLYFFRHEIFRNSFMIFFKKMQIYGCMKFSSSVFLLRKNIYEYMKLLFIFLFFLEGIKFYFWKCMNECNEMNFCVVII